MTLVAFLDCTCRSVTPDDALRYTACFSCHRLVLCIVDEEQRSPRPANSMCCVSRLTPCQLDFNKSWSISSFVQKE